jgi:glycosyltransferase involved in cell wall biosynthesis
MPRNSTKQVLVSCIMATRNRPALFRQAMRYFLRQSYRRSELIVIDDGEQPVAQACSGLERIRYIRLRGVTPMGTKLNIGIECARGEILHKFDDDDYYHADFLKTAVAHLAAGQRERSVVGWNCFLIWIAGEDRLRYSGESFTAGGTLCFDRRLWLRIPFRNAPQGVDSWFLLDHKPHMIPVNAPEHFMLVRHGGNTWAATSTRRRVDDFLRSFPVYPKSLDAVLEPVDRKFYQSLGKTAGCGGRG